MAFIRLTYAIEDTLYWRFVYELNKKEETSFAIELLCVH
ncbi:hypothetical protein SAMN05518872_10248 [Psychrobacillus sp. OK032]|nr:hypothetical protein SAMN05518872_10248 [Psychrobacillus sp. OK032]